MTHLLVIASLFTSPLDIVDGDAARDRLWLRAEQGTVTVYDRKTGQSSVAAEHVLSTDRGSDGGVIALIFVAVHAGITTGTYEFRDIAPQAAVASRFDLENDKGLAMIAGAGPQSILTAKTIMSLDKGSWQAARLTAPLTLAGVIHGVQTPDGVLVASVGGPLYSINRMTGVTREVKLGDATIANVSALSNDVTKPGCVLVAVAQDKAGYVARVCGQEAETVFTKTHKDGSTAPVLGVVSTTKGWVAVAGGKVIRESGRKTKESTLAKPKSWKGLMLQTSNPEFVLVQVAGREAPLFLPVR